ncbi:MAG: hypothetical protein M5U19_01780 [Microthrixaceae bacterium]|nr:hypothetical protein [Microthrixaceae bacterium]
MEGRQAVRELLLAGRRNVIEVFLSNDADRVDIVEDIVGLAGELRVPLRAVSRTKLDHMARTDSPRVWWPSPNSCRPRSSACCASDPMREPRSCWRSTG